MAMNSYGNAFNTYKNNSVNFASKEQLLLMLVDGAAKFSKIGRQAILDKDVKKAHENIIKTQNIFYELMATLDVEKGGEWAESLMKVYDFVARRLTDANIKKSEEIMNEIIPLIDDVRDTWNEAYKVSKGGK
ncbi:flagellar export chaperone FliS [Clostridium tagluense]|uniref:flagellar export chaperone FliS n=1 Tax=Clostridium tagluense TaxID=360422 RepID=UPI001CF4AB3B|nr:flagellar export chaperone FliS [Clostridium tagluense]MCB2310038.1 flagellar export chaperone FliS [Clostridium tagluense]MCB2314432.1 flagellar export chaperone FliS [Clostridium tagluense]MCB2319278.1 flagellar export chaperone FliS [Clostridium tagluense]MCB2324632.1 flagellar export chaperone FliS [Clostridium tagluense]MCB2329483.1 flagellar export chaperone FliS [Clostridium tagluense]